MKTIVVFDKDFLMIKAFQRVISRYNDCELIIVRYASELHNVCQATSPDMLFIGISEKEVDLVRTVHDQFKSIAIFVMTFSNDFSFLKKLINVGIKDYLFKPISIPKITSIIEAFNQNSQSNYLVEKLLAITLSKHFQGIHDFIDVTSDYIYKEYSANPNKVRQELAGLLEEAMKLMNLISKPKKELMLSKFTFSCEVIEEKYRLRFQLFQLVDEVFKQQAIQKTQQLQLFYNYIDQHLSDNMSLSEAAEACRMSQGYLSRLIKERYNISFSTYIHYRKIELAKELFYFNDEKIIDVSFQLAYSESSYFCKVFKKIEGVSPLALKKDMALEKELIK